MEKLIEKIAKQNQNQLWIEGNFNHNYEPHELIACICDDVRAGSEYVEELNGLVTNLLTGSPLQACNFVLEFTYQYTIYKLKQSDVSKAVANFRFLRDSKEIQAIRDSVVVYLKNDESIIDIIDVMFERSFDCLHKPLGVVMEAINDQFNDCAKYHDNQG